MWFSCGRGLLPAPAKRNKNGEREKWQAWTNKQAGREEDCKAGRTKACSEGGIKNISSSSSLACGPLAFDFAVLCRATCQLRTQQNHKKPSKYKLMVKRSAFQAEDKSSNLFICSISSRSLPKRSRPWGRYCYATKKTPSYRRAFLLCCPQPPKRRSGQEEKNKPMCPLPVCAYVLAMLSQQGRNRPMYNKTGPYGSQS